MTGHHHEHEMHAPDHHPHDPHGAGHHGHGAVAHVPMGDISAAYTAAYEAAEPDPGRQVVVAHLEPREMEWEFRPGRRTRAWGFNGQVPGPVIEAQVGDVIEVRLTNRLNEPTVIHWHGLRIPAAMDGTEMVQWPVAPGESFTYRFKVPDAGTFWYHPHLNETVQLERGLYGALIVRGPNEPHLDAERILVLDDVQLDRAGQIKPPGWWLESHDGREGSTRLVNGRQEPDLTMAAGQVERWRIVNAASARYVRLSIGGRPFRILGTDGGLIRAPFTTSEVLLAPADRVDLAVGPFFEGETLRVESLPFNRGSFRKQRKAEPFATLRIGPTKPSHARVPERLREIAAIASGAGAPTREVRLGFKLSRKHGVDFTINRELHHRAEPCRVGELQVWDIVNRSPVHHPFHLHGFFFQVLAVNGEPPAFRSWEDTVNVPAFGTVRIAWVPDDRPGEWMYHCHILEHHAAGMMAHVDVVR
ncbi:MAG TPA: multicopper oxidase family protein [Gemmatimonadaceae bacterium]|nr:multicopper oxidase family protein [Gemmatimonadaceae bacterium]